MQRNGKDFSGKKFNRFNFSNQNLQYVNFRGTTLIECDFTGADLRYANFTGANCYGSNFTMALMTRANMTDANLQRTIMKPKDAMGITLTWKCETFKDMEIDETWLKVWLFMPCQMKISKEWDGKLLQLLGEKTYLKYKEIFSNRIV